MAPQALIYTLHVLPFAALWIAAVRDWLPILDLTPESGRHFILFVRFLIREICQAPVYVVVFLGIYAVCSVLYGVATFNDCPQARAELVTEIEHAKVDLRKRKVRDLHISLNL